MADRQTTGGYPKHRDGDHGRHRPGRAARARRLGSRFEVCTQRQALAALLAQEQALMAVERDGVA